MLFARAAMAAAIAASSATASSAAAIRRNLNETAAEPPAPALTAEAEPPAPAKTTECTLKDIPTNPDDFDEPAWEDILEIAFPTWEAPPNGCPRLDEMGGSLDPDRSTFPTPEEGKFNPCYYTKAFAGLDPMKGGYPTPIDTKYPYEFAAPYMRQPGDGSTHHCAHDAVDVGACPKVGTTCGPDCAVISEDFGIGFIPPFVALASVKNAYNSCEHDVCAEWFDFDTSGCNIVKEKLDELVIANFGDGDTVKFQPPILLDGKPSSTYFKLEYGGESPACDEGNCRGPHYCTKEVADAGVIWGDFCPYVLTGDNAGLYRHPHLALAALELWIANQCMPDKCASAWLDSPAGKDYGKDPTKMSTSITWTEMEDNNDPMAQPVVPYVWPNKGDGIYPGLEALYGDNEMKDIKGAYEMKDVNYMDTAPAADVNATANDTAPADATDDTSSAFATSGSLVAASMMFLGAIAL